MSNFLTSKFAEDLDVQLSVSSVNYSFFKRIQLRDFYLSDQDGDTLIYAELAKVRLKKLQPDKEKGYSFKSVVIENAYVNFTLDSTKEISLQYLIDKLKHPHVPPELKTRLYFADIKLIDSRFSLSYDEKKTVDSGVNFSDLHLKGLQVRVKNLQSARDTVSMDIISLKGHEISGFDIINLRSRLEISKHHMHFASVDIKTRDSDLHVQRLFFNYSHSRDFNRFSKAVDLDFASSQSELAMSDLAYFIPGLDLPFRRILLDGFIHGRLNNLRGKNLLLTIDDNSTLAFDFRSIGLPEIKNTFMDLNFRELHSSVRDIEDIFNGVRDSNRPVSYPWGNLGNLDFEGRFTGYPDQFVANGLLISDMGKMLMDLSFEPDSLNGLDFMGRLRTRNFNLGTFLRQEKLLGGLDMDIETKGRLFQNRLDADLRGIVDTLELHGYAYSNIVVDGAFSNETFDGGFRVNDPNIRMDFKGRMDMSGDIPSYKFTADVARARPYFLNLGSDDPRSFASFLIKTDVSGNNIDELNGEIHLINSLFEREDQLLQFYDMKVTSLQNADSSGITINSGLFDATIGGRFKLSSLPAALKNLAEHYIDIQPGPPPPPDSLNRFFYHINLKRINSLLDFFLPSFQVADGAVISGLYQPLSDRIQSSAWFPGFSAYGNHLYNLRLNSDISPRQFALDLKADSLGFGKSYALENQELSFKVKHDTARLRISWDNHAQPSYAGELHFNAFFLAEDSTDRRFVIDLSPTDIMVRNEPWQIYPARMEWDRKVFLLDSLFIESGSRQLMAHTRLASGGDRNFGMKVRKLDLAGISRLSGMPAKLGGFISGDLNYKRLDEKPFLFSDLHVDTLRVNDILLGKTRLNASWDEDMNSIYMDLASFRGNQAQNQITGYYTPASGSIDFEAALRQVDLRILAPYLSTVIEKPSGNLKLDLKLNGSLGEPELNGSIAVIDGYGLLSFSNVPYRFSDEIRVFNNNLYFDDFSLSDSYGHLARASGSISSDYLKDFRCKLNIAADNILCLNTRAGQNETFYGTIFGSGTVGIEGPFSALHFTIKAGTGDRSRFFLPLYNASEVKHSDFITFIEEEKAVNQGAYPSSGLGGISLDLAIDITPDARVQLIFDPKVGDIIETNGKGSLRMKLDRSDGFQLYGDVELQGGDYLFTLQNVINKRFEIEPGGKISFSGSPTNAKIDLKAIYGTRCAPLNLWPGDRSEGEAWNLNKRLPVECHLSLQGDLQSPSISTGIEMPTANPETRNLLENSTSTDEELMRQFLSLLVINNFYSVGGYSDQSVTEGSGNLAGITASELLSNQLSNWLSQISDDFDIGINYRPGDQVSSDEVEVALSTQLLDDRVIISGNLDVGGQESNISTNGNPYVVGDLDLEFRVTDNVSLIAFNRSRDELLFSDLATYKQGVGVSYREDFDDLNSLLLRYKEGLTNRKKKKKKK